MNKLDKLKSFSHFMNEKVYRLQNSEGDGPFSGGAARLIPESFFQNTLPAEKAGFPVEVYNLLVKGIGKSGCKSYNDLVNLFTEPVINSLREAGFEIVEYTASIGWEAGNQIIFIDEANFEKIKS